MDNYDSKQRLREALGGQIRPTGAQSPQKTKESEIEAAVRKIVSKMFQGVHISNSRYNGGGGGGSTTVQNTATINQFVYTSTAGQTVISGVDSTGKPFNVSSGNAEVYINGVLLSPTEYDINTTTNQIVLHTPLSAGQTIVVKSITGAITTPQTSSAFITDTFTGDGTTTRFPLSSKPSAVNQLYVFLNTGYQTPSSYSLDTSLPTYYLVFGEAPPSGYTITINAFLVGAPGTVSSSQITYTGGSGTIDLKAALDSIFNSLPSGTFSTINGNTGSTSANLQNDTLNIIGTGGVTTQVTGDTLLIQGSGGTGSSSTMPRSLPIDIFCDLNTFGTAGSNYRIDDNNKYGFQDTSVNGVALAEQLNYIRPQNQSAPITWDGSNSFGHGYLALEYVGTVGTTDTLWAGIESCLTPMSNGLNGVGSAPATVKHYYAARVQFAVYATNAVVEFCFLGGAVLNGNFGSGFLAHVSGNLGVASFDAVSFWYKKGVDSFWKCRYVNPSNVITDITTTIPVPTDSLTAWVKVECFCDPSTSTLAFKVGANSWTFPTYSNLSKYDTRRARIAGVFLGKIQGVDSLTSPSATNPCALIVDWVRLYCSSTNRPLDTPSFTL